MKNKIVYIDILRFFAMIAVVIIHTSGPLLYEYNTIGYKNWMIGNFYDSISRWSVPIFVMISGMLILDRNQNFNIRKFFANRFVRVIIPFIAWELIYYIWRFSYLIKSELSIKTFIKLSLEGKIYFHFWFIYMLIGLYIATPILITYIKNSTQKDLDYFLCIWFATSSLLVSIKKFFNITVSIDIPIVVGYIGYYVLGYYIHKYEVSKMMRKVIYVASTISILITIIGTYWLTLINNGKIDAFFYDNFSPNVIITSIGIYTFAKYNFNSYRCEIFEYFIKVISNYSFGIYFLHVMIIDILASGVLGFTLSVFSFNSLISIPILVIIVSTVSFAILQVLGKIPILRFIVK